MKNIKIIFILLFISVNIFSQTTIKGVFRDSITNKVIPYATIELIGKNSGCAANNNGYFIWQIENFKNSDSVKISALGYNTQYFVLDNIIKNDSSLFYLSIKPIELQTAVIKQNKVKNLKVGSKKLFMLFSGIYRTPGTIDAMFINNNKKMIGKIKSIGVYITKHGKPKGSLRLRIFGCANDSIYPYEDLINDQLIINSTEGGEWVDVDISKYNIAIPKQGFFIGVETIKTTDEYYYTFSENQHYGPVIGHTNEFDKCYTFQKRLGSDWYSVDFGGVYFNLMVRARLSVWE